MRFAASSIAAVADSARQELLRQGVTSSAIEMRRTAHVRLAGADTSIELPWDDATALTSAFVAAYHRLYGFAPAAQPLVVASVMAEAIETVSTSKVASPTVAAGPDPSPSAETSVWHDGAWHGVPTLTRANLAQDARIHGPLLLCEAGATSWIAPHWTGTLAASGMLVLRRDAAQSADMPAAAVVRDGVAVEAAPSLEASTAPDPMRLEVFNALFMHVAEQMGAVLRQTRVP
jgi:5-oxoprolinase (ATP-hydrolysing)